MALVWSLGSDPLAAGVYVDAWASRTEVGTLGEWRRYYSFINVVSPDGMRECDLDWRGDFSTQKCWQAEGKKEPRAVPGFFFLAFSRSQQRGYDYQVAAQLRPG